MSDMFSSEPQDLSARLCDVSSRLQRELVDATIKLEDVHLIMAVIHVMERLNRRLIERRLEEGSRAAALNGGR